MGKTMEKTITQKAEDLLAKELERYKVMEVVEKLRRLNELDSMINEAKKRHELDVKRVLEDIVMIEKLNTLPARMVGQCHHNTIK